VSALRKISAVAVPADVQRATEFGTKPVLRWVAPTSLLVDATYQRDLGVRSRRLIERLVSGFAWSKMKPPVVVAIGEGYHCVDGQHTAIAAATLRIPEIPVFVIEADTVEKRADSFVAHNRDRVAMTPLDIFKAKLASNDPDAIDVRNVCNRAGVAIKVINPTSKINIGDTASVSTIQRLVKRQGVQKARMVMEALVKGGRAPISAAEIDATEAAMILVRPSTTIDEMAAAIIAVSDHGVLEAKVTAASDGKPQKHVLFERYMQILEKQTGVKRALAD
jgi:hypothetical protein